MMEDIFLKLGALGVSDSMQTIADTPLRIIIRIHRSRVLGFRVKWRTTVADSTLT